MDESKHEWPGVAYLVNGFAGWLAGDIERSREWLHKLASECGIQAEFGRVEGAVEIGNGGLELK
jgi:hypothetical protein